MESNWLSASVALQSKIPASKLVGVVKIEKLGDDDEAAIDAGGEEALPPAAASSE